MTVPTCSVGQMDFINYSMKDGLPSDHVYSFAQDKDGFMWIGTERGLCKFDGAKFDCKGFEIGLPNIDILSLSIDDYERLWISTRSPAPCYLKDDSLYFIDYLPHTSSLNVYVAKQINDSLLIKSKKHAYWLDAMTLELIGSERLDVPKNRYFIPLTSINIQTLYRDSFFRKKTSGINTYQMAPHKTTNKVRVLSGGVWDSIKYLPEFKNSASILDDSLFFGRSGSGLYYFNLTSSNPKIQYTLAGVDIYGLYRDTEKSYWIGSKNKGFYISKSNIFKSTFRTQRKLNLERTGNIIYADNEDILISVNESDILHLDNNLDTTFIFRLDKPHQKAVVVKSRNNNLLIFDFGVKYVYNPISGKVRSNVFTRNETAKKIVAKDSCNYIIFSNRIINVKNCSPVDTIDFNPPARVAATNIINNEKIWFGTSRGLYQYNLNENNSIQNLDSLITSAVVDIVKLSPDTIICATSKEGLLAYAVNNGKAKRIAEWSLPSIHILSMTIQKRRLYALSPRGIYILELPQFKKVGYVPVETTNNLSRIFSVGNNLLIQTSNQVHMLEIHEPDAVALDVIKTIDVAVNEIPIGTTELTRLSYKQNNFSFEFGFPYFSRDQATLVYQLNGFHRSELRTENRHINLTNIPHGRYKLSASFFLGQKQLTEELLIPISIMPPWYQSWWFIALCLFFICLVTFYFLNDFRKKKQAELALAQQRLNAIHAQMNPHFLFNALQSLQYYINKKDVPKANAYLNSFATLVRKTLDSSAKDSISIQSEVAYLTSYLELEKDKLDDNLIYQIKFDEGTLAEKHIPSMMLQPFVENAIVHGFTDSKQRHELVVDMQMIQDDKLRCTIIDNGEGMKNKKSRPNHKSFATKAIEKKLQLINKLQENRSSSQRIKIKVLDNADIDNSIFDSGTTVEIFIPIIEESDYE